MIQTELGRLRLETLQQALIEVIRSRFPAAPESFEARIGRVRSLDTLHEWLRRAAVADSLAELERLFGS